jgi:hypothetical protein
MPLAVINSAYVDSLIVRLSHPLADADRDAFARAAQDAVTHVPCWGEGALYRAVAPLQRAYRIPPSDRDVGWDIEQELRDTKLKNKPPIEYGGDLRHVRYRKQAR